MILALCVGADHAGPHGQPVARALAPVVQVTGRCGFALVTLALAACCQTPNSLPPEPTMLTLEPPAACNIQIDAAGMSGRTPGILERERRRTPILVADVVAGEDRVGEPEGPAKITDAELFRVLGDDEHFLLGPAAFVAGRCRVQDPARDAQVRDRLVTLLDSEDADVRVEAAMSLLLRSVEPDKATDVLRREAAAGTGPYTQAWLAAYYLAQMGDPSGYPALVECTRASSPNTRLFAARQIIGFAPYDGQQAGGLEVSTLALLEARLRDHEVMVRREVPGLLMELAPARAPALLDAHLAGEDHADVRAAIALALDAQDP